MERYYSSIIFIILAMLLTTIIHFVDNETLSRRAKKEFTCIAILIFVCTICEFLGIYLNGTDTHYVTIHGIIKAIEFSGAPIIPILYVKVVSVKDIKMKCKSIILGALILNVVCECISIFTPFTFYIDENNIYVHGKFYILYVLTYFSGIIFFIFELFRYTAKYQRRNNTTLLAIVIFLILGFSVRIFYENIHTDWLVVSISLLLFIIYYSDLSLKVDPLTSLLNRKSYENRLKKIDYETAIILLDADYFKNINDTYGHQFGDKILKIIAKTILQAYGKYGYCYRIGGDEFCVILKPRKLEELISKHKNLYNKCQIIDILNNDFDELLVKQYEEFPMLKNGVSKGYAIYYEISSEFEHTSHTINEAIKMADERMYKDKQRRRKTV